MFCLFSFSLFKLVRRPLWGHRSLGARFMDIIGCCFKKWSISKKSTWWEFVIFTERELEAFNSSVLYCEREFIVLRNSSDKVATLPGRNLDNTSSNRRKSGENNQKKVESTAADERKHKQDCWKQFVETNSKTSQAYGEHSWGMPWNKSDKYKNLKLDKVMKKISLKIGFWVLRQSWASTRKWSKN